MLVELFWKVCGSGVNWELMQFSRCHEYFVAWPYIDVLQFIQFFPTPDQVDNMGVLLDSTMYLEDTDIHLHYFCNDAAGLLPYMGIVPTSQVPTQVSCGRVVRVPYMSMFAFTENEWGWDTKIRHRRLDGSLECVTLLSCTLFSWTSFHSLTMLLVGLTGTFEVSTPTTSLHSDKVAINFWAGNLRTRFSQAFYKKTCVMSSGPYREEQARRLFTPPVCLPYIQCEAPKLLHSDRSE